MMELRKVVRSASVEPRNNWPELLNAFLSADAELMEICNWSDHYSNVRSVYFTARTAVVRHGYDERIEVLVSRWRVFLHRKPMKR